MWVAREKDGTLCLWLYKPYRDKMTLNVKKPIKKSITDEFWNHEDYNHSGDIINDEHFYIDESLFSDLKWEDEPIEVELTIVNKKQESDKSCSNCRAKNNYPKCRKMEAQYCDDWLPMYKKKK